MGEFMAGGVRRALDTGETDGTSAKNQYLTYDFHRGLAVPCTSGDARYETIAIQKKKSLKMTYSQLPRRSACNGSRGTSSTSTALGLLFI